MVISLGIAPVGVGDTAAYANWAVAPALPPGAIDLGPRTGPNLELLSQLKPDLAVGAAGYGYEGLDIERFAPLHTLSLYGRTARPPVEAAAAELKRLAERLSIPRRADDAISAYERGVGEARTRLAGRRREPLLVVSIFEDRHVRVYGRGGLFHETLGRLGLENAWPRAVGGWGYAHVNLEDLYAVSKQTRLVTLDPIPEHLRIRLARSALWTNLPFVREGRLTSIAPVWPFGGLAAGARFAAQLADGLPQA